MIESSGMKLAGHVARWEIWQMYTKLW